MASTPTDAEASAREMFERACRDDTFDALKRRAAFDRQEAGRLRDWMRAAQVIASDGPKRRP
jgi:hypothetical protein